MQLHRRAQAITATLLLISVTGEAVVGIGMLPFARSMTNPKDGAEMVLVPNGPCVVGKYHNKYYPRHVVTLPSFYIYRDDVTVAQFETFCTSTGRRMPKAVSEDPAWSQRTYPMLATSSDAQDYCRWAGMSLPTLTQWEKAARGTDGRVYPWGNEWNSNKCVNSVRHARRQPAPVGQHTDSPYGLSDIVGNEWQWCIGSVRGKGEYRALRGGAWDESSPVSFRADVVIGVSKDNDMYAAFRCVSHQAGE